MSENKQNKPPFMIFQGSTRTAEWQGITPDALVESQPEGQEEHLPPKRMSAREFNLIIEQHKAIEMAHRAWLNKEKLQVENEKLRVESEQLKSQSDFKIHKKGGSSTKLKSQEKWKMIFDLYDNHSRILQQGFTSYIGFAEYILRKLDDLDQKKILDKHNMPSQDAKYISERIGKHERAKIDKKRTS